MAPQEGHDMEKNSAMTQKGKPRTSVQDFTEHIEPFSKSRRNIPKQDPNHSKRSSEDGDMMSKKKYQ